MSACSASTARCSTRPRSSRPSCRTAPIPRREPGPHYFVHYKGWKQTWDEWVDESRALKFTEENLAKQKALWQAALQASKKRTVVVPAKHTPQHKSESESQPSRNRKRMRESS
ncbi:Esa1p-associated factor, partial [Coemansia sp. RSA 2704]